MPKVPNLGIYMHLTAQAHGHGQRQPANCVLHSAAAAWGLGCRVSHSLQAWPTPAARGVRARQARPNRSACHSCAACERFRRGQPCADHTRCTRRPAGSLATPDAVVAGLFGLTCTTFVLLAALTVTCLQGGSPTLTPSYFVSSACNMAVLASVERLSCWPRLSAIVSQPLPAEAGTNSTPKLLFRLHLTICICLQCCCYRPCSAS